MNWDIIKEKASLKRKTPEMIEERYIELLKQCKQVIQDHEAQLNAQDKLYSDNTDSTTMIIEQQKQNNTITPTKIQTTPTLSTSTPTNNAGNSTTATTSASKISGPSTKPEEIISYINAKKLLQRIELISKIRDALNHPQCEINIRRAHRTPALPKWWEPGLHDLALLRGVIFHGIGRWEFMIKDPILPFYELEQSKQEKKTRKLEKGDDQPQLNQEKLLESSELVESTEQLPTDENENEAETYSILEDFPKEKIIMKRLEHLCKLILDPQPLATPTVTSKKKKKNKEDDDDDDDGKEFDSKKPTLPDYLVYKPTKSKKRSGTSSETKANKGSVLENIKKYTPAPRDENGNLSFPIQLGVLTVYNLGKVVWDKADFHSAKYIWPVGYKSERLCPSTLDPEQRVGYISEIIDVDNKPMFKVTPTDCPDNAVIASTPTSAWTDILTRINNLKTPQMGKRQVVSVSGPEYFGFSNSTIAKEIQELPGADKCSKYQRLTFVDKAEYNALITSLNSKENDPKDVIEDIDDSFDIPSKSTHSPPKSTVFDDIINFDDMNDFQLPLKIKESKKKEHKKKKEKIKKEYPSKSDSKSRRIDTVVSPNGKLIKMAPSKQKPLPLLVTITSNRTTNGNITEKKNLSSKT